MAGLFGGLPLWDALSTRMPGRTSTTVTEENDAALAILAGSKWVVTRAPDPRDRALVRRHELWVVFERDGFAYGRAGSAVFTGRWRYVYGTVVFTPELPTPSGDGPVAWAFLGSLVGGAFLYPSTPPLGLLTGDQVPASDAYTFTHVPLPKPFPRSGTLLGLRVDQLPSGLLVEVVEQEGVAFNLIMNLVPGRHDISISNGRVVADSVE